MSYAESDEYIFDDKGDDTPDEFGESSRIIHFSTPTRKIKDLFNDFKSGDLDTRPVFQRGYVWEKSKASRLIESILMKVPIPPVYTAQNDDETEVVIDGQQRLLSAFAYMDGKFPKDNKEFSLNGLKILKEINSLTFKELDKTQQRAIENYPLQTITILKDSDKDVRFDIFERLNTGSTKLNDQEIRNCVFRGKYNELLKRLSDIPDFQYILNSPSLHERMKDTELILRFFAFSRNTYLNYKPSPKQFLNHEMETHKELQGDDVDKMEKDFKNSVSIVKSVFDNKAFKRYIPGNSRDPNGSWEEKKFNKGLFDIIMFGFKLYDKSQIIPYADAIREEMIWLMSQDEIFIDSLSGSGTDAKEKIQIKFDRWLTALRNIIGYEKPESRAFSYSLKESLYKSNPICAYEKCGQKIVSIDDAEVDHIQHYWRGGTTLPSNARLLHRYCNRKRGGNF